MHLFTNHLMINLICEFSNNFLHKSSIYYNILIHNFQIFFWNFNIYSISYSFLKLYKEDATTTPIASSRIFVVVDKAPCPQFHKKSSHDTQNQHFLHFLYFIYSFTYVFIFFTILMRIGFQWCILTYKKY
jgi:hypothetical protein